MLSDTVDDAEFIRLLKICRIHPSESELPALKKNVDEILTYFNSLEEVDTKHVKEAYHPIDIREKFRNDNTSDFPDIDLILKNTKTYRFYVVGPDI